MQSNYTRVLDLMRTHKKLTTNYDKVIKHRYPVELSYFCQAAFFYNAQKKPNDT